MARRRSALRNRVEVVAFEAAVRFFGALPAERAEAIGRGLGLAFRAGSASRRRIAEANLARAFPAMPRGEVQAISRDVFAHFGGIAADLVHMLSEDTGAMLGRVEIAGEERARSAVAEGRGVFFLTAHLGNWELGALAAATLGLAMTVVARPLDNPVLEERLRAFREIGRAHV